MENHSQGPEVRLFGSLLLLDDFWCQVANCSLHLVVQQGLGSREIEVTKLDHSCLVEQHVFRLQITVDNSLGMHIKKSFNHLGGEDADFGLLEPDLFVEDGEQIALGGILELEVEPVLGLNGFVELQDVFMLQGAENRFFDEDLLYAFFGFELPLFDHFECEKSPFQVRHQVDLAEKPRPKFLEKVELIENLLLAPEFLVREVFEANGLDGFSELLGQFLLVLFQ